ncbi:hypothetical protein GUITHDRAFT_143626 [Guillardia theta CCMP2712]|uniref:Glycine-rich domain-containing protein n=1 Tax=Guillardia theta (strain CCMP2712) TaxID=905079 RepID=L1ISY6_GUITC|nr:hypothetical protein GUITHDRAFT_143626 [Guillardia theta CCMP2712]EKX39217.1 hypothetical protein GUITHDRAFT_143626 [Guillardia theta CCMP2712]|eukprot:XP_005826197.1 hypothetical protein GUITHDRAFT_143626 [Guillardia theta CCMP2712]
MQRVAQILAARPAWGVYHAEDWDPHTRTISESFGRQLPVTSRGDLRYEKKKGFGADAPISSLNGNMSSAMLWPFGSIPRSFTICAVTRYAGSNRRRIIQGSTDFTLGHYFNAVGVSHSQSWMTQKQQAYSNPLDWLVICTKNSGETPANVKVYIWEHGLSADDMEALVYSLKWYLSHGIELRYLESVFNPQIVPGFGCDVPVSCPSDWVSVQSAPGVRSPNPQSYHERIGNEDAELCYLLLPYQGLHNVTVYNLYFPREIMAAVVVLGGGGGGAAFGGGGGGGGVLLSRSLHIAAGFHSVTVGRGGGGGGSDWAEPGCGGRGFSSSFDSFVAEGGGGGASRSLRAQVKSIGHNGGSGGGGSGTLNAGLSTQRSYEGFLVFGNDGGSGTLEDACAEEPRFSHGGGGGAGAPGASGHCLRGAGAGGRGIDVSPYVGNRIGQAGWIAGGGGGGAQNMNEGEGEGEGEDRIAEAAREVQGLSFSQYEVLHSELMLLVSNLANASNSSVAGGSSSSISNISNATSAPSIPSGSVPTTDAKITLSNYTAGAITNALISFAVPPTAPLRENSSYLLVLQFPRTFRVCSTTTRLGTILIPASDSSSQVRIEKVQDVSNLQGYYLPWLNYSLFQPDNTAFSSVMYFNLSGSTSTNSTQFIQFSIQGLQNGLYSGLFKPSYEQRDFFGLFVFEYHPYLNCPGCIQIMFYQQGINDPSYPNAIPLYFVPNSFINVSTRLEGLNLYIQFQSSSWIPGNGRLELNLSEGVAFGTSHESNNILSYAPSYCPSESIATLGCAIQGIAKYSNKNLTVTLNNALDIAVDSTLLLNLTGVETFLPHTCSLPGPRQFCSTSPISIRVYESPAATKNFLVGQAYLKLGPYNASGKVEIWPNVAGAQNVSMNFSVVLTNPYFGGDLIRVCVPRYLLDVTSSANILCRAPFDLDLKVFKSIDFSCLNIVNLKQNFSSRKLDFYCSGFGLRNNSGPIFDKIMVETFSEGVYPIDKGYLPVVPDHVKFVELQLDLRVNTWIFNLTINGPKAESLNYTLISSLENRTMAGKKIVSIEFDPCYDIRGVHLSVSNFFGFDLSFPIYRDHIWEWNFTDTDIFPLAFNVVIQSNTVVGYLQSSKPSESRNSVFMLHACKEYSFTDCLRPCGEPILFCAELTTNFENCTCVMKGVGNNSNFSFLNLDNLSIAFANVQNPGTLQKNIRTFNMSIYDNLGRIQNSSEFQLPSTTFSNLPGALFSVVPAEAKVLSTIEFSGFAVGRCFAGSISIFIPDSFTLYNKSIAFLQTAFNLSKTNVDKRIQLQFKPELYVPFKEYLIARGRLYDVMTEYWSLANERVVQFQMRLEETIMNQSIIVGPDFDEISFVIPNILLSYFEREVGVVTLELQQMESHNIKILNRTYYNISEIIAPYIVKSAILEFVPSVINQSYIQTSLEINTYALVEVLLIGVYNPPTSGRLNKLAFSVADQMFSNYSTSVLENILTTPGNILDPSMNLSNHYPGQVVEMILKFTVSNSIPLHGQLDIQLQDININANALQLREAFFQDVFGTRRFFIGNLTQLGQNISITITSFPQNEIGTNLPQGIQSFSGAANSQVIPSFSNVTLRLDGLETLPYVSRVFFSIQTKQYFGDYIDIVHNVAGSQIVPGIVEGNFQLQMPYVSIFTPFALHLFPSIDFVCGYSITIQFPPSIQNVMFTNYSNILGIMCNVTVNQSNPQTFYINSYRRMESTYSSNQTILFKNLSLIGYLKTPNVSGTYNNINISVLSSNGIPIDLGQGTLSVNYSKFTSVRMYARYDFYRGGLSADTLGSNFLTISIRPSVPILGKVLLILELPIWLAASNPKLLQCNFGRCIHSLTPLNSTTNSLPFNASQSFFQLVELTYDPRVNISIGFTLKSFFIPSRYVLPEQFFEIAFGIADQEYNLIQVGTARLNLSQSRLQRVPVLTAVDYLPPQLWNKSTCTLPNAAFWLNNFTVNESSFFQVFSFMTNQEIPIYGFARIVIPLNQLRLLNLSTISFNSTSMVNYRSCSYPLRTRCEENFGEANYSFTNYSLNKGLEISIQFFSEIPNDSIVDIFNLSQPFPFVNPIYSQLFSGNFSVYTVDNVFNLIDTSENFVPQYCQFSNRYTLTFTEILNVYLWDERASSQQYDQLYVRNGYLGGKGGFYFNLSFQTGIRTNEKIVISFPRDFKINQSNLAFFDNCLLTLQGNCKTPDFKKKVPPPNCTNTSYTCSNWIDVFPSICKQNCTQYQSIGNRSCTNFTLQNGTVATLCTSIVTNYSSCAIPYFFVNGSVSKLCHNISFCKSTSFCSQEIVTTNVSICTNWTYSNSSNASQVCNSWSQVNRSTTVQRCTLTLNTSCTWSSRCFDNTSNTTCQNKSLCTQWDETNITYPCPENSSQCLYGPLESFNYTWGLVEIPPRSTNPPDRYNYSLRQAIVITYYGNLTLKGFSFSLDVSNPLYGLGYPPDIHDRYSYLVVLKGFDIAGMYSFGVQERIEFQILVLPQLLNVTSLSQNTTAGALAEVRFSLNALEFLWPNSPQLTMLFPAGSYSTRYRLNTNPGAVMYLETFASFSQAINLSVQVFNPFPHPTIIQSGVYTNPSLTNSTSPQLCVNLNYSCSDCLAPAKSYSYQQQYLLMDLSHVVSNAQINTTLNALTVTVHDIGNPLEANILPGYFDFTISGEFFNQRQIIARAFGIPAERTTVGILTVDQVDLIENVVNRETRVNVTISLYGVLANESYLEFRLSPQFPLYLRNGTFVTFLFLQYEIQIVNYNQDILQIFLSDSQLTEMYKAMEYNDAIQSKISVSFCCLQNPPHYGFYNVIQEIRAISNTSYLAEFQGNSSVKNRLLEDYRTMNIQLLINLENKSSFGKGGISVTIKFNQTIYADSIVSVSFPVSPFSPYQQYSNVFYDVQTLRQFSVFAHLNQSVESTCQKYLVSNCLDPVAANISIVESNDPGTLSFRFGSDVHPCQGNCSNSSSGLIAMSIDGKLQNPRRPESNFRLNASLYLKNPFKVQFLSPFKNLMEIHFLTGPLTIEAFKAPFTSLYSSSRLAGSITWLEIEYRTISGMQANTKDYIEVTLPKGYKALMSTTVFNSNAVQKFYPGSISCLKTPIYAECISFDNRSFGSLNISTQVLGHTRGIYGTLQLTKASNNSLIFERCSNNFDVPFNTTILFRFGPVVNPLPASISYSGKTVPGGNFAIQLKDQNDFLIEYAQIAAPPIYPDILPNVNLSGKVFRLNGSRSSSIASFEVSFLSTFDLFVDYEIHVMLPQGYFVDVLSFNYTLYQMSDVIQQGYFLRISPHQA